MFAKIAVAHRFPAVSSTALRAAYSTSRVDGSTAQSKEFSKKERAHEDQYARQHEAEQLKKLREQIEKKKEELAQLEQEHSEIAGKQ
ncbi:hypothetical protein NEOLEDRAFT_385914 [Neolentinus lepideus HHB14362 ss-1]|uniref:ATPase inhibitor, mitochondrial n=1 Tax=Neolentinus lepideus HHB14362 ss-1 TaxID=1314782 RepID=A0A165SEM8_9AGAM|nr:hypothetical protein NEOLEDRAFT_385914 [Neolentinus lepideus HHB14362 ss-1]